LSDLLSVGLKIDILNYYVHKGDVVMVNKMNNIGNISNNTFGDNVNFMGDHVTQTKSIQNDSFQEAYDKLLKDIYNISDELKKETALFIAQQIKEAMTTSDPEKAKKPLRLLRGILGDVASIASIASFFGLSIDLLK
jgi:hypothetical protein